MTSPSAEHLAADRPRGPTCPGSCTPCPVSGAHPEAVWSPWASTALALASVGLCSTVEGGAHNWVFVAQTEPKCQLHAVGTQASDAVLAGGKGERGTQSWEPEGPGHTGFVARGRAFKCGWSCWTLRWPCFPFQATVLLRAWEMGSGGSKSPGGEGIGQRSGGEGAGPAGEARLYFTLQHRPPEQLWEAHPTTGKAVRPLATFWGTI